MSDDLLRQYQQVCGDAVIALGDVLDRLSKLRFKGEDEAYRLGEFVSITGRRGYVGAAEKHINDAIRDLRCYRDGTVRKFPAQVVVVERRDGELVARCCHRSHGIYRPSKSLTRVDAGCFSCNRTIKPGSRIWRAVKCRHTLCEECARGTTDLLKSMEAH